MGLTAYALPAGNDWNSNAGGSPWIFYDNVWTLPKTGSTESTCEEGFALFGREVELRRRLATQEEYFERSFNIRELNAALKFT